MPGSFDIEDDADDEDSAHAGEVEEDVTASGGAQPGLVGLTARMRKLIIG
jgi:hypothetical protein